MKKVLLVLVFIFVAYLGIEAQTNDRKANTERIKKNKIFKSKVRVGDHIRITTEYGQMYAKVLSKTDNGIEVRAYESVYGTPAYALPKDVYFQWDKLNLAIFELK
jgi:hypothetical protein